MKVKLDSFQDYIDKAIGKEEVQGSGDFLNDNVLVNINLQVCTQVRLPIAKSISLSSKTAEINLILNLIRNAIIKGNLDELHISDMTVCDLLRWNYEGDDNREGCTEYNPVYGQCSQEYKFPRY